MLKIRARRCGDRGAPRLPRLCPAAARLLKGRVMTVNGWLQIATIAFTALVPSRPLHGSRVRGRARLSPALGPWSVDLSRPEGARAALDLHRGNAPFNAAGLLATPSCACRCAPLNPADQSVVPADLASTPPSASPAAPTGRTTVAGVSYLTQMMALTTQNFVSAAMAHCVNGAFAGLGEYGRHLGRPQRCTLYILLPISFVALFRLAGRAAEPRRLGWPLWRRQTSQDRRPPRSPSSSSAPTAAASNSAMPYENPTTS